jgi:hypothetical protein
VVQAVGTADGGPVVAGVGVGRELVVDGTGRPVVVVTGAAEVVVTAAAVVVVVDGAGRVVAVVGGSLSRLATDRVDPSGERGHRTAAPTATADSTTTEISRRRRDGDVGGEGSNTAHHFGQRRDPDLPKCANRAGHLVGAASVPFGSHHGRGKAGGQSEAVERRPNDAILVRGRKPWMTPVGQRRTIFRRMSPRDEAGTKVDEEQPGPVGHRPR